MLQDITFGQFFPIDSILHRLDPRIKIASLFILVVLIFIVDGGVSYAILTTFLMILIALSKVPLTIILKSLKPLVWIIALTFIVHLFSHEGEVLWKAAIFEVTDEGLKYGALISLRLVLLIMMSSLLTFTTSPLKLTDALEKLLSPLSKVGISSHELAMIMTIALRFIPTLLEETDKIIKAQSARGVDFESGNILRRIKLMVPVLVPLFLSAFRRADALAMAMEARCYRGGEGRTHMKELQIKTIDYTAAFIIIIVSTVLLYLKLNQ